MIDRVSGEEYLKVLIFVVAPLAVLLIVGLWLRVVLKRPSTATFSDFAVTVSKTGHEQALISYRRKDRSLIFDAEVTGPKQVDIYIPEELPIDDIEHIVSNLELALQKMRYEYLIYKTGKAEAVSKEEREAAIAELRQKGFEVRATAQGMEIMQAASPNRQKMSRAGAKAVTPGLLRLLNRAQGKRASIQILARSHKALDRVGL